MSTINLSKGQKVDLTKTNPTVRNYFVGLGWNPNANVGDAFDADVSAFILGEDGKLVSDSHFVFYNNLKSPGEGVVHTGDNRTGEGEGDDEKLIVDFARVGNEAKEIIFVVTIHDAATRNQNFGQISGAYIRVGNNETNEEILKFDLNEDYSTETAVVFGRLYLKDGEWKFDAVGTGRQGGLQEFLDQYKK